MLLLRLLLSAVMKRTGCDPHLCDELQIKNVETIQNGEHGHGHALSSRRFASPQRLVVRFDSRSNLNFPFSVSFTTAY